MLRYYSYYSVGGYKDFYMGSSADTFESSYYFNLLPVWERRAKEENDEKSRLKVEDCKQLPLIQIINTENNYGLPKCGDALFSHAGYKLIYKHLEGETYALSVREIEAAEKDEVGRSIPFLFIITCDSKSDLPLMDKLAAYAASHLQNYSAFIASTICYDPQKNGLRFDIGKLNKWVEKLASEKHSSVVTLVCRDLVVNAKSNKVSLLVIPDGIPIAIAQQEQNLGNKEIQSCYLSEILPADDVKQAVEMLRRFYEKKQEQEAIIASKKRLKLMALAATSGLIIGFVSAWLIFK